MLNLSEAIGIRVAWKYFRASRWRCLRYGTCCIVLRVLFSHLGESCSIFIYTEGCRARLMEMEKCPRIFTTLCPHGDMAEMAASHFLQVQVKSQVISLQVQVKSQVISLQVQVKSQVIWSDVKSRQVTSHLVQTQVKSQFSLSKYKSSRTLFCPAVISNQGQTSNQSTVSYSQRYMKWSMVLNNFYWCTNME